MSLVEAVDNFASLHLQRPIWTDSATTTSPEEAPSPSPVRIEVHSGIRSRTIPCIREVRGITDQEQGPTPKDGLFRAEALEHQAQAQGPGAPVRIAPSWISRAFYGLIALLIASIAAGSLIQIQRYATGIPAWDSEGRVVVLIPAALASDVVAGNAVDLGGERTQVISSGSSVVYPPEASSRYGVAITTPSLVVTTAARPQGPTAETARVFLGSEPAIVALIPGLKGVLGDDG